MIDRNIDRVDVIVEIRVKYLDGRLPTHIGGQSIVTAAAAAYGDTALVAAVRQTGADVIRRVDQEIKR